MQGLYLHRTTQHRNKRTHTSMPRAGFEPTIPVLERPKTVRASDRVGIGTGSLSLFLVILFNDAFFFVQIIQREIK